MCKNKILEKLLAIILIFTLTFANFALVTESFASSIAETLFGEKSDTGHKNVEFEAYFGTEEEKETSVISDVNTEDLSINLKLSIKKTGYLKDGKIEILENEEGKGLNFKVNDELQLPENVQSFEDNTLYLKQIENSSEVSVNLPITYENEEYVNENKLSRDAKVYFSGIYVDEKGEEKNVSREIVLNVSWKDERDVRVESEATKYIDFGKGVILQTSVKVDNLTEKNTLPVKNTNLSIQVPELDGKEPSKVTVVANTTEGTNGKTAGNVVFDENNWNYDSETNTLTISVENSKQLVQINNTEDYLKEAEEEKIEEERYYSKSGIDEYFITYTYEDIIMPETLNTNANIKAELTTFSGVENDGFINVKSCEKDVEYSLEGKTGDIVSLSIENETKDVSKAYMYVNNNHKDTYEIELNDKTIINIAYKDIVQNIFVEDVENFYKDKQSNKILTDDIYYKKIIVSKENFNDILGEDGEIKILDVNGNEIAKLNKDYQVDEENNLVVNLESRYSKLNIQTTAPLKEGNLVIHKMKAITNSSLDKETLKNVSFIGSQEKIRAKYNYVENIIDVQDVEKNTALLDTDTRANLVVDRDSLSTLAKNENVELRIELNNAKDTSDVYGHSVFEIEMPSEVQSIEVTNANLVYGEGLSINSVEVQDKIIRVTLDGVQDAINSGVLTNGTNIELNANINVDLFAPAKTEQIKLHYSNDEATNYSSNGYEEKDVTYSAPAGLVAVNSTSNYDAIGSTLTSVRQGSMEGLIDIYKEAKVATMDIIVMNNNNNNISDISILGRIPFKGVKDIATNDDLGTTIDTRILSGIVPDERNNELFKIYYSENGEATNDLNDSNNRWNENPETFDNVKSYLIVPVDSNYEMQKSDVLKFTYQYEIPGNLPHNEKIYGTFLAYYTNHSEVATTEEKSTPDKVGLTTGKGPEVAIDVKSDRDFVKEFEEIETTVTVTNVGEEVANDVVVNIPIPESTKYKTLKCEKEDVTAELGESLKVSVGEIEINKSVELKVYLTVKKFESSQEPKITLKASVTAKDLGTELVSNVKEVEVKRAEFSMYQYTVDTKDELGPQDIGTEIEIMIQVKNLTNSEKSNVEVTQKLDDCFEFISANVCSEEFDRLENSAKYDESTRTITWNIDKIKANNSRSLAYKVKIKDLSEGMTRKEVKSVSEIVNGDETYKSNALLITAAKSVLSIVQTTNTTDTYVKEGNTIDYVFTIKNEGSIAARKLNLTDIIPEGLVVRNIEIVSNGFTTNQRVSATDKASVNLSILPKEEAIVTVKAFANGLNGVQEKTVTNVATLASNVGEITTNSITHIIEADESTAINDLERSTSVTSAAATNRNITKTYKVTGTAWLDANENGMRELDEELLSGISAKLVNSETGVIAKSITTDTNGTYTFAGVENGKYIIVFDYDTVKYTVTSYQKENVAPNVNSDAITTQIEQNGKIRNAAVTDVIEVTDGSISNIDIGFVFADIFDLKLDKTITKITVQTAKGTTTQNCNNETFTKTEIASKYVSGSTVYIEYAIKVTNVGDIAGYARKIVDYLPEGMTFNSSLKTNENWYTGTDKNLYTTALANTELASGQSQEIKLVLTKQMTADNTGVVSNLAEIYEDYNIYGVSDKNSTPANKAQGENDLGKADAIILIKTGEVFVYISVIITSILLGSVVIFVAYNRIVLRKRKGGV